MWNWFQLLELIIIFRDSRVLGIIIACLYMSGEVTLIETLDVELVVEDRLNLL